MAIANHNHEYGEIRLQPTDTKWIAVDEERRIVSAPMETWEGALDDLVECVELAEGDLEYSDHSDETVERSRQDFENGDYSRLEES